MTSSQDGANSPVNPVNSTNIPTSAYVPPADSSSQANQTNASTNNSAEIDRLLAELDKLSKDLESNKQEAPKEAVNNPVAPQTKVENKTESSEEKFDFDSFLNDLEKKIDQETKKVNPEIKSASMDTTAVSEPEDSDFRKNRSMPSLDVADQSENQATELEEKSVDEDDSEDLKSQNIFDMLGLDKISDEEKNHFLDELEMMIWDDFVAHDLELLLTSEEYGKARQILDEQAKSEDERKESLILFLEKLVPDLDEVLYEKALELKSEMMAERLNKLKENTDPASIDKVKQAEAFISENRWRSAASLLNS